MEQHPLKSYRWACMGTPQITVDFLDILSKQDVYPDLLITNPPKPVGRKQTLTPSLVQIWAEKHTIPYSTLKPQELLEALGEYDFVCVFAYGALLPQSVLATPRYGVVNIHPSLLPHYRGPSPITTAILDDSKHTGVSLMQVVKKMDAGPIIAQSPIAIGEWAKYHIHEKQAAEIGGRLFLDYLHEFLQGNILPQEQNDAQATFCPRYSKQDMEIHRQDDDYTQYRTYCAFPKPFFINTGGTRIIVSQASFLNETFIIKRVIPEGKAERDYSEDLN